MSVLLTDKKIKEAIGKFLDLHIDDVWKFDKIHRILIKAQLKKGVEYGDEPCPHAGTVAGEPVFQKRECPVCWQALRREAGLEKEATGD